MKNSNTRDKLAKIILITLCFALVFSTNLDWTSLSATPNKHFIWFDISEVYASEPVHTVNFYPYIGSGTGSDVGAAEYSIITPPFNGPWKYYGNHFGATRSYFGYSDRYYEAIVSGVRFETASIPDEATVISAKLNVMTNNVENYNGFNLNGEYFNFINFYSIGTETAIVGTNAFVWNMGSFSANTRYSIPLSNISNINKTGNTAIRISLSDGKPTSYNSIEFRAYSGYPATDNPYLTVTYSIPPTTPTLTAPNGEGVYNNSCNITWNASTDADGDPLTYHLQYSLNNGSTWTNIASGVSGTSYNWNIAAIPESTTVLVRVRAYDGYIYSSYDQSDAVFEIKHNQNPTISVTEPSPNGTFSAVDGYNTITLAGTVSDADAGDIITTKYNIDGGEAQTIPGTVTTSGSFTTTSINVSSLSEGAHTLNVWAEDNKGGSSAITAIPFYIDKTPPTTPSLVPDIIGPTNTDVIVTIENWGDATNKQYRIDGGPWQDYIAPILITKNCILEAMGTDSVGNISETGSLSIANIFKAPNITTDTEYNYLLELEGNLQPGWQYQILVRDKLTLNTVCEQTYAGNTTNITITKEILAGLYACEIVERVIDNTASQVIVNIVDIYKELDRLEYVDPVVFLPVGAEQQYQIRAIFHDGTIIDNFDYIDWNSNNANFVIDANGIVTVNAEGTANITATGKGTYASKSVSIPVTSETLTDYIFDRSNEKAYVLEGDVIQYSVDAVFNPTVANNYTNVIWAVDDTTIGTIDQTGKLTTIKDGVLSITVTDKTLTSFTRSFTIHIHKKQEVTESSSNDFIITLNGDLPAGWKYRVIVKDTADDSKIYDQMHNGDTTQVVIAKTLLKEGHTYQVIVRIIDSTDATITEAIKVITKADTTAPTITRVYLDNGKMYVIARDNVALNAQPYKYMLLSTSSLSDVQAVINSEDPFNMQLLIEADRNLNEQITDWIAHNYIDKVKVSDRYKIMVRDASSNINEIEVTINKVSGTIWGELSPEELAALAPKEKESDSGKDPTPSTHTQQVQQAEQALAEVVAIADNTPVNSSSGQLTIDMTEMTRVIANSKISSAQEWKLRLEIIEKFSGITVYSKLMDKASKIVIPDLDDATVYLINVSIVNEKGEILGSKQLEQETPDRTPPIITSLRTINGSLILEAKDNKKLAALPYKYENLTENIASNNLLFASLDDSMALRYLAKADNYFGNTSWTAENKLEGVAEGLVIKTTVRDEAGNTTEQITIINSQDAEYVCLENVDEPIFLQPGTVGNIATYFNKYMDLVGVIEYTSSDESIAKVDDEGLIYGLRKGEVIITAFNKTTDVRKQLLIKVRNLNVIDNKRIIVEKGSITNAAQIYKDYISNVFLQNPVQWYSGNPGVAEVDNAGMVKAISEGISKITVTDGEKNIFIYCIVAQPGTVKSDIQEINIKMPFVLKKGTTLEIKQLAEYYNFKDELTYEGKFVVFETDAPEVVGIEDNVIIAKSEGVAFVQGIDLVNNIIARIKIKVEDVSPRERDFTDVGEHWAGDEVKTETAKSILRGFTDGSLKLDKAITNVEFVTLMSRLLLKTKNETEFDRKTFLYEGLNEGEWYYNNTAYVLSKMADVTVIEIFGSTFDSNREITRGQVAEIIADITKGKLKRVTDQYNFKDLQGSRYEAALRYCIEAGLMIGNGNGEIQGDKTLTRAEMITIFNRLAACST